MRRRFTALALLGLALAACGSGRSARPTQPSGTTETSREGAAPINAAGLTLTVAQLPPGFQEGVPAGLKPPVATDDDLRRSGIQNAHAVVFHGPEPVVVVVADTVIVNPPGGASDWLGELLLRRAKEGWSDQQLTGIGEEAHFMARTDGQGLDAVREYRIPLWRGPVFAEIQVTDGTVNGIAKSEVVDMATRQDARIAAALRP